MVSIAKLKREFPYEDMATLKRIKKARALNEALKKTLKEMKEVNKKLKGKRR